MSRSDAALAAALALSLLSSPTLAQDQDEPAANRTPNAEDVAMTPITDLNLAKDEIPSALLAAQAGPYASVGIRTCDDIAAAIAPLDAALLDGNADARPGSYVALSLRDDGTGMPAEVRERAFAPCFTTKPQGIGTGLGLSVCRDIVTRHHGTISIGDRAGRHVFVIDLPHHSGLDAAASAG